MTIEQLRNNFTAQKRCCVDGEPEARTVWLQVGNQSFGLDGYQDNDQEAEWMRLMLAKALRAIIKQANQKAK